MLKQGDQTKGLQHLGPSIMLVNWVRALWNKEVCRYIVEHVIRVPHRRFLQSELKILYDYLFNNIAQTREDQTKRVAVAALGFNANAEVDLSENGLSVQVSDV